MKNLIKQAEKYLGNELGRQTKVEMESIFQDGAFWMFEQMQKIDFKENRTFDNQIYFAFYGFFKYSVCVIFFLLSMFYTTSLSTIFSILISIITFYWFEVNFLFLFPILIDKYEKPLFKSIKMTYEIGYLQCILTVIPIAFFMLFGLLNWKNPLKNWYIGCLAILVWYCKCVKKL